MGFPAVMQTAHDLHMEDVFDLLRKNDLLGVFDKETVADILPYCVHQYELTKRFPNGIAEFIYSDKNKQKNNHIDYQKEMFFAVAVEKV